MTCSDSGWFVFILNVRHSYWFCTLLDPRLTSPSPAADPPLEARGGILFLVISFQ